MRPELLIELSTATSLSLFNILLICKNSRTTHLTQKILQYHWKCDISHHLQHFLSSELMSTEISQKFHFAIILTAQELAECRYET